MPGQNVKLVWLFVYRGLKLYHTAWWLLESIILRCVPKHDIKYKIMLHMISHSYILRVWGDGYEYNEDVLVYWQYCGALYAINLLCRSIKRQLCPIAISACCCQGSRHFWHLTTAYHFHRKSQIFTKGKACYHPRARVKNDWYHKKEGQVEIFHY